MLHPHEEAQLLAGPAEHQAVRLHGHGAPSGSLHRGAVLRAAGAHVGHRADDVGGPASSTVLHERDGYGGVVEVAGVAGPPGGRPALRPPPRYGADVLLSVIEVAEEGDIVPRGSVVDEPGVHGSLGIHVARAQVHDGGSVAGGLVKHGPAPVVPGVGRGHQSGLDRRRAPPGMRRLEQGGHAGHVRASHGSPGKDVELRAAAVGGDRRWAHAVGPRRQDVQPRRDHVRLEDIGRLRVRPSRRERRHHRRRPHAQSSAAEDNRCLRRAPLWRVRDIAADEVSCGGADGRSGEDVAVGDEPLAVEDSVGKYHGHAAGLLDHLALGGPGADPPVADHDLSLHRGGVQRALQAKGRGVTVAALGPGVEQRVQLPGGQGRPAVHADAGNRDAIPEPDVRREVSVHGARSNGGHPRRHVRHRKRPRATVAGGSGDEDPGLGGREGADGDRVEVVRDDDAAHAEGDHVDAVGHCGVEGGEDVGVEAAGEPADLVHGESRLGSHAGGDAPRIAQSRRGVHVASGGDGGRVRAVAVGVPRRARLRRLVHAPRGRLVPAREEPRSDHLLVTQRRREVSPRDALALPLSRRRTEPPIGKAPTFRPYPGINDGDNEVRAEVRFRQETCAHG